MTARDTLVGQRVVIVGGGKSGIAAAKLARARGAEVTINDYKPHAPDLVAVAESIGAAVILGGHPSQLFESADLVVLSPGVPPLPVVDEAERRGVRVIPEVELSAESLRGTLIGITGSNGKSTVTSLVGAMARRTSRPTFVGGNLGDALALAVDTDAASERGLVVAELSSFQLERTDRLRCHIAACLNVTEDHLDRHGTFAAYAAAKGRIFRLQSKSDAAVVPAHEEISLALARGGASRVHTFGGQRAEVCISDGVIIDDENGLRFPVDELKLQGNHNRLNACAAALIARLAGIEREHIEAELRNFAGLPHRMVLVRTLAGVSYFDDSKATNVGAAAAAIDGLAGREGKVVLIAGGVDKGGSYAPLRERMESVGRGLVLIGEAAPLIADAFAGSRLELTRSADLASAITAARKMSRPGDAVLLAPACSSFDMFRSYSERGDEFARLVALLEETS